MKKISLFVLALSTSAVMFAQDGGTEKTTMMARKTYFGFKAGADLAEFRIHDAPSGTHIGTNMKTSFNGGFFVNIPLGTKLYFQPEALYLGAGSKLSSTVNGVNVKSEQDLGYVAIPLMFQVKSKGGFVVELGPQVGFLVNAKSQYTSASGTNVRNDNVGDFDRFDLALGGGIGYMSRVGLGINARYNLGLTNTIDDGGGNNSPNNGIEYKNSVVMIGLSYMFGANK